MGSAHVYVRGRGFLRTRAVRLLVPPPRPWLAWFLPVLLAASWLSLPAKAEVPFGLSLVHPHATGFPGIPLILVHGNRSDGNSDTDTRNNDPNCRWQRFINHISSDTSGAFSPFDVYVWRHHTSEAIGFNGTTGNAQELHDTIGDESVGDVDDFRPGVDHRDKTRKGRGPAAGPDSDDANGHYAERRRTEDGLRGTDGHAGVS